MAVQPEGTAPYTAFQALQTVINGYRERGLSVPFTNEVLVRAGVSETLANRTMQSLEILDLIHEDGRPTAEMEGLRRAGEDDFKERLAAIIRAAYADVFQYVDPATQDAKRIHDAFRAYNPVGQRDRMVSLFLKLCEWAGIIEVAPKRPMGPKPQTPRSARAPQPSSRRGSRRKRNEGNGEDRNRDDPPPVGGLFGITADDLAALDDAEFQEVWAALGKVARKKGRPSPAVPIAVEEQETETEEDQT